MGHFYENSIIPQHLRRNFDVYERMEKLELDLGTLDQWINRDLKGANICTITFHESGLVYICLLYSSPSPRDLSTSRMPSSA